MIGPSIPPDRLKKKQKEEEKTSGDEIVVALSDDENTQPLSTEIGPQIPSHLLNRTANEQSGDKIEINKHDTDEDEKAPTMEVKSVRKPQTDSAEINISEEEDLVGPALATSPRSTTPPLPAAVDNVVNANPDDFAPVLPPELLEERRQRQQHQSETATVTNTGGARRRGPIGPALPPGPLPLPLSTQMQPSESDDDDLVGPVLPSTSEYDPQEASKLSAIQAIEQRARQSKEAMEKKEQDIQKVERPEWMLVPPEVDYLKNANSSRSRGFASGSSSTMSAAERDSTAWTETPAEREHRLAEEQRTGVKRKAGASVHSQAPPSQLDEVKRRQVEEINMQTRPMSLLEMHQQNRKKKKKSKLTDEEDVTKRGFDRDKDLLAPRQMDTKQKKEFLKQTAQMGRNFGYGSRGSFL
ncbi:hypothetical protein BDF20DRAFT_877137 [Mycotypha africana]|uniref:uncharacterized protein n=1 Tax=Mycotypha africana TaxID=64632 RepID=UPI0023007D5C|nr:uncharacterized protein BDF20DRAFT_877137 [Mycotypha africana]KAI8975160.1 hypothetical protein BDF20DRAFT_877137 [Mycotypha africana]